MRRVLHLTDRGIVLSPDLPGGEHYAYDGGGVREASVVLHQNTYYLSYDGAMPGATPRSYWNACLAESCDLLHWKKLGPRLLASELRHPGGKPEQFRDLKSASSPWFYFDKDLWHIYYLGADHCNPEGVPGFCYSTMYAQAKTLTGEWVKRSDLPGRGAEVCFPTGRTGSWDDATASPGQVLENPLYSPGNGEYRYLMFYSGSCSPVTKRSLGIARTNHLSVTDNFDRREGNFWVKDPDPILSPDEDIENSSVFYEEESGLYWLFTNHIYNNQYTDAVWVYWSKNINRWKESDKAVVVDAAVSSWAKGAIGMPSVVRRGDTLALLYDGVAGDGTGHLGRQIGLCEIALPIAVG